MDVVPERLPSATAGEQAPLHDALEMPVVGAMDALLGQVVIMCRQPPQQVLVLHHLDGVPLHRADPDDPGLFRQLEAFFVAVADHLA